MALPSIVSGFGPPEKARGVPNISKPTKVMPQTASLGAVKVMILRILCSFFIGS
jgi:hypothetical protein